MSSTHRDPCHKPGKLVQWFDICFPIVACFATLLATMVVQGKVIVGEGESEGLNYDINIITVALLAVMFIGYMWYILTHSDRELKEMVNHVYGRSDEAAGPAYDKEHDA